MDSEDRAVLERHSRRGTRGCQRPGGAVARDACAACRTDVRRDAAGSVAGGAFAQALSPGRGKPCKETECSLKFEAIADLRLLEISNVTCIAIQSEDDTGKFFVLSKSKNLNKLDQLIAILPVTNFAGSSVTTSQAGPFYFNAGKRRTCPPAPSAAATQ